MRGMFIGIALLITAVPTSVLAYCIEPNMYNTAPSAPFTSKPNPPFCMRNYSYTKTHTCSDWEIDRYIARINDYIRDMNSFIDSAYDFANKAVSFANNAEKYALCEISEVKSQIE